MFTVNMIINGNENTVATSNPLAEVQSALFKDRNAKITILMQQRVRRVYEHNAIVEDYPSNISNALRSLEDFAREFAWLNLVGGLEDYMGDLRGTTKRQRTRKLERARKVVVEKTVVVTESNAESKEAVFQKTPLTQSAYVA